MGYRSSRPEVFFKRGVLKSFTKYTGKHLSQSLFFNKVEACNLVKKETQAQVVSREFCEIFKNTFFTEHLQWLLLQLAKTVQACLKLADVLICCVLDGRSRGSKIKHGYW